MPSGNDKYSSYVLRFRLIANDDQPTWIAALQDLRTGELMIFPDLEELLQFIQLHYQPGVHSMGERSAPEMEGALPHLGAVAP